MGQRIEDSDVEQALGDLLSDEPDILVTGDEVFPEIGDPDESLSMGLERAFTACRLSMRSMMRSRFGRVVAVAPPLNRACPDHAASMGGLGGLMKSLAREVGTRGVTANVVSPGHFETAGEGLPPYLAAGRLCTGADVAAAIRFLIGEQASYVTGQVITVDGGLETA
jgi:3-oxoacyl-[acyl-carrier protein] reductase